MAAPSKADMQPSVENEQTKQLSPPTVGDDDATIPIPIPSAQDTPSPPSATSSEPSATTPAVEPHPQTEEIIRQVEYYFSDENLPHDAHLLSKTGLAGTGWVSLNEILSWKKMRAFKPPARVKASVCKSKKLIVWKNKFIRRMDELEVPITASPREDPNKELNKQLVEKPWLTKGLMKPTGFEKGHVEDALSPAEHEQYRKLFDPDQSFPVRIDNAVARYMSKRRMHQLTLQIFTKYLMFGGFSSGPHQFTGGLTDKDMQEMELDSEQILQMKSQFAVSNAVLDGIDPDYGDESWVVDFKGMAESFLSSHFMHHFDWEDAKIVETGANILRNFYNYLLYHDVCPEYKDQIMKAREVCDAAEKEFATLAQTTKHLPGDFNIACSTLCAGHYALIRPFNPNAEWVLEGDKVGMSNEEAMKVFIAGHFAHGDKACLDKLQMIMKQELLPEIISEEDLGLEVVRVEKCTGKAKTVYDGMQDKNAIIKPTGKLQCIRWDLPHRPPKDLPQQVVAERKAKIGEKFEIIVDEEALQYCYPGLKIEGIIKQLNTGIKWIDSVQYVYPSFHTWTLNEPFRDWKPAGPPKAWMVRQMYKRDSLVEQTVSADGKNETEGENKDDTDNTAD